MDTKTHMTPAALAALAKGDVENFFVAATPGGIEQQEAAGQQLFVGTRDALPKDGAIGNRALLESIGFVFGEDIDDLFVSVTLPKGWSKRATEHSMWSEVLDDKGRKRAHCFYKGAFYDRNAHMSIDQRYKTHKGYEATPARYQVRDFDGTVLLDAGCATGDGWEADRMKRAECEAWLNGHYPDWQNPAAYWD